ncbi:hypothetical protein OCA96_16145, partial [Bacillus cereus]|nr:hypothetical protein [Bacillus cereus]
GNVIIKKQMLYYSYKHYNNSNSRGDHLNVLFNYIESVTGKKPEQLLEESFSLPRHLSMTYDWKFVKILDFECLLLQMHSDRLIIENLLKHLNIFEAKTDKKIVLIFNYLTSEQRARLISNQIPFIVTDIQMYLPFVFLDFRKEATKDAIKKITKFTPSNQLIFLYIFYLNRDIFYSKEIESQCKISAMTVNRTLKLLTKLKIIQMLGTTYSAKYTIIKSRKEMLDIVTPLLINPIRKTIYVEKNLNLPYLLSSGEFALSQLGMLSYNKAEQYAIGSDEFKEIKKNNFYFTEQHDISSFNLMELQVWVYNPDLVRTNMQNNVFYSTDRFIVDILSLYISLINIDDERLQMELEKLLNTLLGEQYDTRHADF